MHAERRCNPSSSSWCCCCCCCWRALLCNHSKSGDWAPNFPNFRRTDRGRQSKGGPGQGDAVRCISGPNTCQKAIQIGDGW
jgi:hypothetical protein